MSDKKIVKPNSELGTPVIPVVSPFTSVLEGRFLEIEGLPSQKMLVDNKLIGIQTLKFNDIYDLIGITTHEALVASGHQDMTDYIDPQLSVDSLIVVGVEEGKVTEIYTTTFSEKFFFEPVHEGSAREMKLLEYFILPIILSDGVYNVKFGVAGDFNVDMAVVRLTAGIISIEFSEYQEISDEKKAGLLREVEVLNPLRGYRLGGYRANYNKASR